MTLGLTEREARVYAALVSLKKASVLTIARAAEVKRPTAYLVLEALEEKELVVSTKFRWVTDYRILNPAHLKRYIKKQERVLQANFAKLQNLYEKRTGKMRLRTYEGAAGLKTVLEKVLSERKPLYIIGNEDSFSESLQLYWDFFCKRSAQVGVYPKIKAGLKHTALLLWADKIAYVQFSNEIQAVVLKNNNLAIVYKEIWKQYLNNLD